ncbi:MAG: sigma-E factor negative regulatory protein [Pseudomonadota bacterium]
MSDSTENLSCLMDGELDAEGRQFLLRRLSNDTSMTLTWRRYHLVRACLHQEMSNPTCIAERISVAIDQEGTPRASTATRWIRPLAGGAIAASAALFAIVAINSSVLQRTQPGAELEPGFIAQPTSLDQPFSRQPIPVSFNEMSPAQRQRVNTYVLRHNQAAGGSGFVSYIPIVTGAQGESIEVESAVADEAESTPERAAQAR